MRFSWLVLGALALLAGLGTAGPAAAAFTLPAPASLTFITSSAHGNNQDAFHEVQHGCDFIHLTFPAPPLEAFTFVDGGGSITGECRYDPYGEYGTVSGSVNLDDGSVTFHAETKEVAPNGETFSLSYDGTGGFAGTGQDNFATGSANFTYSCDGTACPSPSSDSGTITWNLSLYPQPACAPEASNCPDLQVDHVELVQALPDQGSVAGSALVRGKSTVARVFVKADVPCPGDDTKRCDAFVNNVSVALTATSAGHPLGGQAVQINNGPVLAAGDNILRLYTNGSANFLLPDNWLYANPLTLQAEVQPPAGVTDSDPSNNKKESSAVGTASGRLDIDYIKVCYPDKDHCPTSRISTADSLLRKLAPVADDQYNYGPMPLPNIVYTKSLASYEDVAKFNAFVGRLYLIAALLDIQFFGSPPTMVYAWLPAEGSGGPYAILTDQQNHLWNGSGVGAWGTDSPYVPDLFLAEGVAHNLGLGSAGGHVICSDTNSDAQTHWPYQDVSSQEVGFDITTRSVVKPAENADLSAHCGANKVWVSPYTWEMMRKHVGGGTSSASEPVSASDNQLLVLSGTAKANGSGGTLDPLYQVTSTGPASVSDPNGTYCLSLHGGSGELSRFCFTPDFLSSDGTAITDSGFAFAVPMPAGTTKVVLVKGAQTLATQQASVHPPTVDITAPVAGDTWTGQQTITWTASDADSDPLTYTVTYSPDGKTWYPMAVDTTDTQFTFNTSDLTPSSSETFRVMASDGFNTTSATVGPLLLSKPSVKGDADCIGGFTTADLTAVLGYVGGAGAPGCLAAADVNCDAAVGVPDVLVMLDKLAALPFDLPSQCPAFG